MTWSSDSGSLRPALEVDDINYCIRNREDNFWDRIPTIAVFVRSVAEGYRSMKPLRFLVSVERVTQFTERVPDMSHELFRYLLGALIVGF
jgi:hypothetical protein